MKIYIARDRAVFEDEAEENYVRRHPEIENQYGRLRLFYETPTFNHKTGVWEQARGAAEIKTYMFPQIRCEECAEFEGPGDIPEYPHYPGMFHTLQDKPLQDTKNDGPFDIPNLSALKQQVTEYVKQHQGDLEFIPTDHPDGNIILTFIYEEDLYEAKEYYVKAVRVNKEGKLQIHYDLRDVKYFIEDLAELDENEWRDIDDDIVYYEQTLMSIAYGLPSYEKICKA